MLGYAYPLSVAVLALVFHKSQDGWYENLDIMGYANCREQGFSIKNGFFVPAPQVTFSRDRHTDKIVVYSGEDGDFCEQGNIPLDSCGSVEFYETADEAADAVCQHLRTDQDFEEAVECYRKSSRDAG